MSIASEITRINTNIAAAYTALDGKGATLPATQNSANLADTIDTITTGGGGGGNPLFSVVDNIVTSFDLDNISSDWHMDTAYSKSNMGNNSGIVGVVYDECLDSETVYITLNSKQANYCVGFLAPNSATVQLLTDENNRYSVTFNNEETYIIYLLTSDITNRNPNNITWEEAKTYDGDGVRRFSRYFHKRALKTNCSNTIQNVFDGIWGNYIDDFKLTNITFSDTLNSSMLTNWFRACNNPYRLLDYTSNISDGDSLPTDVSNTLINSYWGYFMCSPVDSFPFIIDLSAYTGTTVLGFGYSALGQSGFSGTCNKIKKFKMKLPSTCGMNLGSNEFAWETLSYMLQYAPTRDSSTSAYSRTFYVNYANQATAMGHGVDLVAQLQAKNWNAY